MTTVFVDIETAAAEWTYEQRVAHALTRVPANYSKPETIVDWVETHVDEEWRRTALDPMTGRILCIGVAVADDEPVVLYREPGVPSGAADRLLFDGLLEELPNYPSAFVGHNLAGFDSRWLFLHAMRAGHAVARRWPYTKWDRRIRDTMTMWQGPDPRSPRASLASIATFLGIEGKTDGVSGAAVHDLYLAGRHLEIADYCRQDVRVCREVYRRLVGAGVA